MKLAHFMLEQPLNFNQDKIVSWVIEDSQHFWKFTCELLKQNQGEIGNFVLSNSLKTLKLDTDVEIMTGPFDIDFSSKKITNMIAKKLLKTSIDDDYSMQFEEISQKIKSLLNELVIDANLPVEVGDLEQDDLIKVANVKINQSDKFFEHLTNYLELILNLSNPKLLICINVKPFIKQEDMIEFNQFLLYQDVCVLFIDYLYSPNIICDTHTYFLDKDLCEFEYFSGDTIKTN